MYKYQQKYKQTPKGRATEARYRMHRREYNREMSQKRRIALINQYGGKCVKCGFDDWRALQFDHVNGGGYKEMLTQKRNWKIYYNGIANDKTGKYQLLCANCNWIKRYEDKESNFI